MAYTDTRLEPAEAVRILRAWEIEVSEASVLPGSGTANAGAVLETPGGRLFLKRRNPRYARLDWVRFDHALLAHLATCDLPVPQGIFSRDGNPWVVTDDAIYELFGFIEGEQHRPGNPQQLRAAGETLARIHLSAQSFEPPVAKQWERFHDPEEACAWLAQLLEEPGETGRRGARRVLAAGHDHCVDLARRLTDDIYWRLPRTIVQGDYHPANLKFRGDEVAGVFDWDWAGDQPRMVDLADGLLFFCARRDTPPVAGDIWSLTEAFDLDEGRVARFGGAYTRIIEPKPEELAALPDLMRARWLYSRADAAMRKIDPERRAEFVTRDLDRPLTAIKRIESGISDGSTFEA